MKLDSAQLEKLNKKLENPTPEYDIIGGYEVLMTGISKNLHETFGENTAKNFSYQLGANPGKKIGERILAERNGQIFEDPVDALVTIMSRLKSYYQFKINDVEYNDQGNIMLIAHIQCYLNELFKRREDIPKGGILCRINRGYFEAALKILTGKKVVVDQSEAPNSGELCRIKFNFS